MPTERIPADRAVVLRFVAHLIEHGHPDLKVDHWLEDEHPGQSVVEAIAGPFAPSSTPASTRFRINAGSAINSKGLWVSSNSSRSPPG
jgi:hypothetical protein